MEEFIMKQKCCNHIDPTHFGDNINHAFNHRPPLPPPNPHTEAWYDIEQYRPYYHLGHCSCITPGNMQGLYNPNGPLQISPAFAARTILTGVSAKAKVSLSIKFSYNDETADNVVDLEVGGIYNFTYLENGNLMQCAGKVADMWKVYDSDNKYNFYKIKIDCSVEYTNKVVVIKNDQIRGLSKYVPYSNEDTTIANSVHLYGTTIGNISDAVVTNAEVDANGNILSGDIVAGVVDGHTLDGVSKGENNKHHEIMVTNGDTIGGTIEQGKVLSAMVRSGNVDGTVEDGTNITTRATIKGAVLSNAIIVNTLVRGGKTSKGVFLDPTLNDSIVYNAQVIGDDIITVGGVTDGNITTGGTSTGGEAHGGTAIGVINGKSYTIEGGITKSKDEHHKLVTTGGVVVGGTVIGGVQSGGITIGAVVKGGVVSSGTTINGITNGGTIIPAVVNQVPIAKAVHPSVNKNSAAIDKISIPTTQRVPTWPPETDDLIIFNNLNTGKMTTNVGTAPIERVTPSTKPDP